jgi:hypothetical protein
VHLAWSLVTLDVQDDGRLGCGILMYKDIPSIVLAGGGSICDIPNEAIILLKSALPRRLKCQNTSLPRRRISDTNRR